MSVPNSPENPSAALVCAPQDAQAGPPGRDHKRTTVRFTDDEYEQIKADAELAGLSIPVLLRKCYFKRRKRSAHLNQLFEKNKWSNATYNRRRGKIMAIYNWAIKQRLVSENPLMRVPRRAEVDAARHFLTAEQMRMVLDLMVQSPHCICFDLLVNTGMRISEALGLRWQDLDFTHRSIRLARIWCPATKSFENRTKGGDARMVPMNEALFGSLMCERNRGNWTGHDDLIVAKADGTTPKLSGIRWLFHCVLKQLGLGSEGVHVIRHSFASFFMMNGGEIWDLKTILGHSSIDVTERYAHFSMDHLRQQAEKVSFARRQPGQGDVIQLSRARGG